MGGADERLGDARHEGEKSESEDATAFAERLEDALLQAGELEFLANIVGSSGQAGVSWAKPTAAAAAPRESRPRRRLWSLMPVGNVRGRFFLHHSRSGGAQDDLLNHGWQSAIADDTGVRRPGKRDGE